jgi:hypothetical protein
MRAAPVAVALAALAGASAWVSMGALAVTSVRGVRIGALPPLWILAALVVGAAVVAWLVRLRTADAWPLTATASLWAPWLPVHVPEAWLAWEGPLEGLIWSAALGGVIAARTRRQAWWHNPARAPWLLAALFFTCAIGSAAALHRQLPGGDEPHYLVITQSLLYDGDLQIENNHERGDFLEYIETPIPPDFLQRGMNGEIYSVHAPGVSALVLPAYAIAGYAGAVVMIALISALAAALLWRIAFVLAGDATAAWMGTIAVACSATVFLHGFTIFPDPVGAAAASVALWALVKLETSEKLPLNALLAASVCLSAMPWLHTRFVLVAVGFGAVIAVRLLHVMRRVDGAVGEHAPAWHLMLRDRNVRRRLVVVAAIPAVSALVWFTSFYAIYGTPNPSAPYGNSRQNAVEWIATGLTGLALDQQFGLIANAPVFALLPVGVYTLARARRRLAVELVVVAVPYVAVVASFGMWWGGWSAPARFLTCLMPLAVPAMALAWARGSLAVRCLFGALALLGGANVAARVIFEEGTLLYNTRDGFDVLLDWVTRSVNLPLAMPSVHRLGTEPTLLLAAVWALALVVAALVLSATFRARGIGTGASWTITTWTLLACGSLALAVSWKIMPSRPLTPETSKIAFLERWNPDRRPLIVRLPSATTADTGRVLGELDLRSSTRARDRGADPPPLLALRRVPAGEYSVVITGARELHGVLTLRLGDTSVPLYEWSLEGSRDIRVRLPVRAALLGIQGDPSAPAGIQQLGLRPLELFGPDEGAHRVALRGAAYRGARFFFLDDAAYVEPGGVWTRGNAITEIVASRDRAADRALGGPSALYEGETSKRDIVVEIAAGPVPASVEWIAPVGLERVDLQPGERRRIALPPGHWTLKTAGVFRPKDYDPKSGDARPLGVRLEFP